MGKLNLLEIWLVGIYRKHWGVIYFWGFLKSCASLLEWGQLILVVICNKMIAVCIYIYKCKIEKIFMDKSIYYLKFHGLAQNHIHKCINHSQGDHQISLRA